MMGDLFADDNDVEVLDKTDWLIHWGGLKHPSGGLIGQLTKCLWHGHIIYVRENIALFDGHFGISSGERMALKEGRLSKRHDQILELSAPEHLWDQLAQLVTEIDPMHRHVRKNRRFSDTWARATFARRR